ncbi:hypothetical protein QQP08_005195 [Theobroma cacao]|nr:hypothetical protein QQP08_005195 [Theobroma cacao]
MSQEKNLTDIPLLLVHLSLRSFLVLPIYDQEIFIPGEEPNSKNIQLTLIFSSTLLLSYQFHAASRVSIVVLVQNEKVLANEAMIQENEKDESSPAASS